MSTRAATHLHVVKQISCRRARLDEASYKQFEDGVLVWEQVLECAKHLRLGDGSSAVRSMTYGQRLEAGTFGVYTGYTRHIDIAASLLTKRALETCLHEFAHALLHSDVKKNEWEDNEAWLECEADVTADLVLMMMGFGPRQYTQNTLRSMGNVGDFVAFFHHAGPSCIEAAETIFKTWEKYAACIQAAIRVA